MYKSMIFHEIQSFCAVYYFRFFPEEEFICGTASTFHGREVYRSGEDGGTMRSQDGH
jgi:hypothetical protein